MQAWSPITEGDNQSTDDKNAVYKYIHAQSSKQLDKFLNSPVQEVCLSLEYFNLSLYI